MLHEMTLYNFMGPASSLASQIINAKNLNENLAYDPLRMHGFLNPAQDEQELLTEIIAKTYAWMSLDICIIRMCEEGDD